jgi:hypothetical protein
LDDREIPEKEGYCLGNSKVLLVKLEKQNGKVPILGARVSPDPILTLSVQ